MINHEEAYYQMMEEIRGKVIFNKKDLVHVYQDALDQIGKKYPLSSKYYSIQRDGAELVLHLLKIFCDLSPKKEDLN